MILGRAIERLRLLRTPATLTIPRREMGSAAYAATGRARWVRVHPGGPAHRRPPTRYGAAPSRLLEHVDAAFPDMGVLELPRGTVAGATGWIVTPDRFFLPDHSWHGADVAWRQQLQRKEGRTYEVQRVKGTSLSLATFSGWKNYGHFLLDGASRIHLAEAAGFAPASVDHVIYTAPHAGAREVLERLGVPMDRAIEARPGIALRPDRLIAPTFPGLRRNYPAWLPAWFRERLAPADAVRTRRVYIPRTRERLITNIDELMPILVEHGFEVVDPGAHPDAIRVFAEARVVVGGHGAGLSGLVFCQPGTAVLELVPSDHQMPYYYTISDSGGLDYGYLVGPSLPDESPPGTKPNKVHFRIDRDEFRAAIEDTLARADRAERALREVERPHPEGVSGPSVAAPTPLTH